MTENGGRFEVHGKDEQLAVLLAGGATIRSAAEQCNRSERTVARRLADPRFRRRVSELRVEATERAISSLTDAATAAVETLRKLLSADSEHVQLAAAKAILDSTLKSRERDWASRLSGDEAKELMNTVLAAVTKAVPDEEVRRTIAKEFQSLSASRN